MSDDPDTPYDPSLPRFAGKPMRKGGGTLSRRMQASAAVRRQRARQLRDQGDAAGAARQEHDAAYLERHADRFRDPLQAVGGPLAAGNGGEVAVVAPGPHPFQEVVQQPPDMLAAEATEHRMNLTAKVSNTALTLAVEAEESLGARNALERTLLHQMAAGQEVAMTLLARAQASATMAATHGPDGHQKMHGIEAARMATAAARVMQAAQGATATFDRLRNGRQQAVTVQYVMVGDGGQAMVAGTLKQRGKPQ